MPNMDYCKFENTLNALQQCSNGWDEEVEGDREIKARERLIELMVDLLVGEGYEVEKED